MRLVLHAPNVHTGGGAELLRELLGKGEREWKFVQLDQRTKGVVDPPDSVQPYYVRRSMIDRLLAELRLWWNVDSDDVVLCFHGLPPLFKISGRVVVFAQNRLLLDCSPSTQYPIKTALRIVVERCWLRFCKRNAERFIVQTPSMRTSMKRLLGDSEEVSIVPFASSGVGAFVEESFARRFDFVYVASGEPHKGHRCLLDAWVLLAERGVRPSLALTVDCERFSDLCGRIDRMAGELQLKIFNLGYIAPAKVDALYRASGALIYPSRIESFGLPLIEASRHGLPIIAAELDYVRDVVAPIETFDPCSATSIMRAVVRFLGGHECPVEIRSAKEFLSEVVK